MAYKCLDCGHIFEDGEQIMWEESHGFDVSPHEKFCGCPLCKGEYEETTPCEICGSEHLEEELNCGVCDECVDSRRYDIDMCFKVGENDTDDVGLNCFLASMFTRGEIEKILFRELKEAEKIKQIDCKRFIEADRDWFAERLAEEVKKNEKGKKQS